MRFLLLRTQTKYRWTPTEWDESLNVESVKEVTGRYDDEIDDDDDIPQAYIIEADDISKIIEIIESTNNLVVIGRVETWVGYYTPKENCPEWFIEIYDGYRE